MNKKMKFKNYLTLHSPIVIKFSYSISHQLEDSGFNFISLSKALSTSNELLVSDGIYGSKDTFYIFTNQVKLLLKLDKTKNSFVVIGFYPNEFSTRSTALKQTAILRIPEKNSIIISCPSTKDSYFYKGKLTRVNKQLQKILVKATSDNSSKKLLEDIKTFTKSRSHLYDLNKRSTDSKKAPISKELEELLDNTRTIIDTYEEFEKTKVKNIQKVSYKRILASKNKTNDKPHYVLETGIMDYSEYKINTPIQLTDKFGNILVGHIADFIKQDNEHGQNLVEIIFEDQVDLNSLNITGGNFSKSPTSVIANAQRRAVEDIRSSRTKAKYIDKAIAQGKPEDYQKSSLTKLVHENLNRDRKLNESQLTAVSNGIDTNDIYLVMGPPGTGKTSVIVEWVKYFTNEGKRILISSQNNAAVDNVLKKLVEDKNIEILRIGKDLKIDNAILPYTLPEKLRSLRLKLEERANETVTRLEELELKISTLMFKLQDIDNLEQQLKKLKTSLDSTIKADLNPLITLLNQKLIEYNKLELYTARLQKEIAELNLEAKSSKNPGLIKRIKNFLIEDTTESKLQELHFNYEQARNSETILINQINDLKQKLNTIINGLNQQKKEIKKIESKLRSSIGTLEKSLNLNNDFNLFSNKRLLFNSDLKTRNIYISEELKRLSELKRVYKNWGLEVKKEQNYGLNNIILESANVVGSTCIGINSQYEFHNLDFDISIVDEAGQIQIQNALIPMAASEKLIMLGDYNQIPPVVDEELKNIFIENNQTTKLLNTSLFELLYKRIDDNHKSMLEIQYRMPSSIADTVSDFFYEGKYKSCLKKQEASKYSILPFFDKPYVFIDTSDSQSRFENGLNLKGYENKYEATIICNLVGEILKYVKPEEIGIISAYKEQIKTIRNLLKQNEIITDEELLNSMVNTLDSFQGQERDLIIYSFVRSKRRAKPGDKRIGFLKETRRLNVAMTRAKEALILIGDASYLTHCLYHEQDENGEVIPETDERPFSKLVSKILDDVFFNGTYVESLKVYSGFNQKLPKQQSDK